MMLLPVYHTSFLILSYVLYNTEKHDYYRYCDACLGSDRDLFRPFNTAAAASEDQIA